MLGVGEEGQVAPPPGHAGGMGMPSAAEKQLPWEGENAVLAQGNLFFPLNDPECLNNLFVERDAQLG